MLCVRFSVEAPALFHSYGFVKLMAEKRADDELLEIVSSSHHFEGFQVGNVSTNL